MTLRLRDLSPHWITIPQWSPQADPFYLGVSFLCPHCDHTDCPTCHTKRGKRIAVSFWPPIDPMKWEVRITYVPHEGYPERISGETFDDITLAPKITIEGHWSGRIENGVLIDAA